MSKPNYTKDPITGSVIFHDSDAYANRKKILQNHKTVKTAENDNKRVINSLRNEVIQLKEMVTQLLQNKEL